MARKPKIVEDVVLPVIEDFEVVSEEELEDKAPVKELSEQDQKNILIKKLTVLFKEDVLRGEVYTLDLLKQLAKQHLGEFDI